MTEIWVVKYLNRIPNSIKDSSYVKRMNGYTCKVKVKIDRKNNTRTEIHDEFSNNKEIKLKKKLGICIKKRRKILGITQENLAKTSGININTIIKIENGKTYITLKNIGKLAEALKIRVFRLMSLRIGNIYDTDYILDYNSILSMFGNQVKKIRKEQKLSQIQLIKKFPLSMIMDKSYISKIESGKVNITLINIGRIQRALNIHLDKLMDF